MSDKRIFRLRHLIAAMTIAIWFSFVPQTSSAKDITISYADWQLAQDIWGRSLKEAIAEFERQNPGIKVSHDPTALGTRDVKFTTAIRGGAGPDVFALDVNPVKQYIANGWVRDISEFVKKEGGDAFLSDFYSNTLEPVREGGKIYGIPKNVVAMVLIYNEAMFRDAGIDKAPETWAEFREAAKKLTKATTAGGPVDQWGATLVLAKACFDLRFSVVLRGFGGDFLDPTWSKSRLDEPVTKEAFTFVTDMILKDKTMPPGVTQVDCNGARRLLANSKVAMIFGTMWTLPEVNGMNPELKAWDVLKMAHVPQKTVDEKGLRSTLFLKSLFMNPNTKHPEAAWKLIKFLTERQQMQKWFDDNNMLSARRSVNENYKPITSSGFASTVTGEIERAAFLPLIPKWPEMLEAFRQNLQNAVAKTKSPDQALSDAHKQFNTILARP